MVCVCLCACACVYVCVCMCVFIILILCTWMCTIWMCVGMWVWVWSTGCAGVSSFVFMCARAFVFSDFQYTQLWICIFTLHISEYVFLLHKKIWIYMHIYHACKDTKKIQMILFQFVKIWSVCVVHEISKKSESYWIRKDLKQKGVRVWKISTILLYICIYIYVYIYIRIYIYIVIWLWL